MVKGMRNCVFTAGWLLIGLIAASICTAQESTEDAASADIPSGRPSYLTSRVDRGQAIATHEQVDWLNLGGEQLWMGFSLRYSQPDFVGGCPHPGGNGAKCLAEPWALENLRLHSLLSIGQP